MELIESSETSAYNNTLTPRTYPKDKKLHALFTMKIESVDIVETFVGSYETTRSGSKCESAEMRKSVGQLPNRRSVWRPGTWY
jgi:hypothetical protein